MRPSIVLASASPRRRELLEKMGVPFTVRLGGSDERVQAPAREAVAVLAERKARAAAQGLAMGLVLGADTLVALEDQALGKPRDAEEARRMLRALSGREHMVYTGVCLLDVASGTAFLRVEGTGIRFRSLADEEIDRYVESGEPMDKAGAYAIQGGAGAFVEAIEGSFTNVMGLPVEALEEMLDAMEAE